MDLATTASLIVATFDLAVVRSIRDAIRTADISSGRQQPVSGLGPAPNPEPRRHIHPEPVYEPRPHIHPTPKFEERTIYYSVRFKPCGDSIQPPICAPVIPIDVAPAVKCPTECPLPPIWATLPPVPERAPASPSRVIKMVVTRSDIEIRGAVLDVQF